MEFEFLPLSGADNASGAVVVIDVVRAFTTAAYAFAAGASAITVTGEISAALALQQSIPGARLMGENDGNLIPGFDYGNSPEQVQAQDLRQVHLIQRTSAGTQGLVRAVHASALLAASLVVASATAEHLRRLSPPRVTFIATGLGADGWGDEDLACAEYIAALLRGESPDVPALQQRIRRSPVGQRMVAPGQTTFWPGDLTLCLAVNRFNFVMPAHCTPAGQIVLQPQIVLPVA
ncbi:MAG TPA: 2-phosphosulfolactate phosphatase [Anaerolineaceae bacterium]|nr:2-phosphosulfolactate phosphatase [Anaerolineaceae bacterium]